MKERLRFLEVVVVLGIMAILVTGFAPAWTETTATNFYVNAMAMSADGRVILAIASEAQPLISTNYGKTWFTNTTFVGYCGVATSADGSKVVINSGSTFNLYRSTNSGVSFYNLEAGSTEQWRGMASSADGTKLFATQQSSVGLMVSMDSGVTWTQRNTNGQAWASVAVSADGTKVLVVGGTVCISTNSGTNWMTPFSAFNGSAAMSADGREMIVAGSQTYISTNLGDSWSTIPIIARDADGQEVAMTADGRTLYIVGANGFFYWSNDFGMNWVSNALPEGLTQSFPEGPIHFVQASADGGRLVVAGKGIWLASVPLSPQLNAQSGNGNLNLSWTVPSTNLMLEQSSGLNPPAWTMVTNLPTLNLTNLQEQVNLPCTNSSGFFRLGSQ